MRVWVVKAGSAMVCGGGLLLIRTWMEQVRDLNKYHRVRVIWVTSGAIGWARVKQELGPKRRKLRLPEKQALSALGQPIVMEQYTLALQALGERGAQVLLTAGDIRDPRRKQNLSNTLTTLLDWGVCPILNENDAVATEEIQFGDNDSLAAQVAVMMKAERLVLLTDVDGLYTHNPTKNLKAQFIDVVDKVTPAVLRLASGGGRSGLGTGGMASKLLASRLAGRAGIQAHLVRGDVPRNLLQLADGVKIGTSIGPRNPQDSTAKRRSK